MFTALNALPPCRYKPDAGFSTVNCVAVLVAIVALPKLYWLGKIP